MQSIVSPLGYALIIRCPSLYMHPDPNPNPNPDPNPNPNPDPDPDPNPNPNPGPNLTLIYVLRRMFKKHKYMFSVFGFSPFGAGCKARRHPVRGREHGFAFSGENQLVIVALRNGSGLESGLGSGLGSGYDVDPLYFL